MIAPTPTIAKLPIQKSGREKARKKMVSVSAALCSLVWQTGSQKSMFASLQTFSNFVNTRSWDPHLRDEVEDKRNLIPHHIHHTRYILSIYLCCEVFYATCAKYCTTSVILFRMFVPRKRSVSVAVR